MPEEKDTTPKRIKRGFKVLTDKFKSGYTWFYNTQFAKNMIAQNKEESFNINNIGPIVEDNTPEPKINKNKVKYKDPFATDLSNLSVDI